MNAIRFEIEKLTEEIRAFTEAMKRRQEAAERQQSVSPADPSDPRGYCTGGPAWTLDELRRRINEDDADEE